jgi:hypothetical protein
LDNFGVGVASKLGGNTGLKDRVVGKNENRDTATCLLEHRNSPFGVGWCNRLHQTVDEYDDCHLTSASQTSAVCDSALPEKAETSAL